jgi:hypothetical protein
VDRKLLIAFDDLPFIDKRGLIVTKNRPDISHPSVASMTALIVASPIFPACMLTRILSPTTYCRGAGLGDEQ